VVSLLVIVFVHSKHNYYFILRWLKINWLFYVIGWLEGLDKEIKLGLWYQTGSNRTDYTFIMLDYVREVEILICSICIYVIYYSYSYMGNDKLLWYLVRILLFKFGMELIVRSKESILLFLGWELIGWMSYLLVNY